MKLERRRLPAAQRRTAGSPNVRFNQREWETVEPKAAAAGVAPTAWARLAALGRHPLRRRVVPELNQQAWLEPARLAAS